DHNSEVHPLVPCRRQCAAGTNTFCVRPFFHARRTPCRSPRFFRMVSDLVDRLLAPEGVVCPRPEDTRALGEAVAARLPPGAVLSLNGPLGAGKTQFASGLVKGLGCTGEASSPSFALMHEYPGECPVFH